LTFSLECFSKTEVQIFKKKSRKKNVLITI
jgi:hypothetical protein